MMSPRLLQRLMRRVGLDIARGARRARGGAKFNPKTRVPMADPDGELGGEEKIDGEMD